MPLTRLCFHLVCLQILAQPKILFSLCAHSLGFSMTCLICLIFKKNDKASEWPPFFHRSVSSGQSLKGRFRILGYGFSSSLSLRHRLKISFLSYAAFNDQVPCLSEHDALYNFSKCFISFTPCD